MPKGVSISARISQEDAEFISQLSIEGATTPSDKVRAIIADAKRRSLGNNDYLSTLKQLRELVEPNLNHIREAEFHSEMHSELITMLYEYLPDMLACLVSGTDQGMDAEALVALEKNCAERLFRLTEAMLLLKVRKASVGYQSEPVEKLVSQIAQLALDLEKRK